MKKRHRNNKRRRRLSTMFREAAEKVCDDVLILKPTGCAYYACHAIKYVMGVDLHCVPSFDNDAPVDAVLGYYEDAMSGHDEICLAGWFGAPTKETQQERIFSLLFAAEFYGNKTISV